MRTDELVERLVADAHPVRRLPGPWARVGVWLALSLPGVAVVVATMSPRADLALKLSDGRYAIEQSAALATAVAAAVAAFALVAPGRSRRLALLPLLPLAIWLGTLGQGCLQAWFQAGEDIFRIAPDWMCFPGIAMTGAAPALAMLVMLRRGVSFYPRLTLLLGALAAAALGNVGLRLFHPQDASLMVLVWQFGSVAVLSLLSAWWGGKRLLAWRRPAR